MCKITYLKLSKYKRFPLSNVEVFEHEFLSKMTMIVGPNGAGKSSLVSELTPLPPSREHFYKGGYKDIKISHNGIDYRLIADFTDGAKYFFYVGDENLNTSNNIGTQRELVKQHFGLTQVIHDILTGQENFTEMSLITRKKLFNTITHLNIDGVLEIYNDLKEELKNNEFLLKNITSQLLVEKQKLIDPQRVETLVSQKELLKSHIDNLLNIRTEIYQFNSSSNVEACHQSLSDAFRNLEELYTKHYVLLTAYPFKEIDSMFVDAQTDLNVTSTRLTDKYNYLEQLLHEFKSLQLIKNNDLFSLKQQEKDIKDRIDRILSKLNYITDDFSNIEAIQQAINILESSIQELVQELPINSDKRLSKNNLLTLVDTKNNLLNELSHILKEQAICRSELSELKTHQQLNCPNCNHTWLPSETENRITINESKLDAIAKKQMSHELEIQKLNKEIDEQQAYLQKTSMVMSLYKSTKDVLNFFWNYVSNNQLLTDNPTTVLTVLRNVATEAMDVRQVNELKIRLTEIQENIDLLERVGVNNIKSVESKIAITEEEISELQCIKDGFKDTLNSINLAKSVYVTLTALNAVVASESTLVKTTNLGKIVGSVMAEIDLELSKTKVSIIEIEKEISGHAAIENSVKKYEVQIADIQENIQALDILTDELSPKSGLIAKTISNFLNVIISGINRVIAGVWDYKMVLKVINVEEDALNYRFKVEVEDKLVIEDVSKVSSGMKEIINLALKITLFKLLKLENYPMYLDEFGVKLDKVHRAKIADTVFKMINNSTYSQIFLITHLDMAYGDFRDTEVIEL